MMQNSSDFGMERTRAESFTVGLTTSEGTPSYMAPEIIGDKPRYTKAGDVLAFASLMDAVMSKRGA
jgi:serine/threonine protein kinase